MNDVSVESACGAGRRPHTAVEKDHLLGVDVDEMRRMRKEIKGGSDCFA